MRTTLAIALNLVSASVFAQNPAPPNDPLVGTVALGYLSTSGNTDSTNANASFKATWDRGRDWIHNWSALAISARTNGLTTAEAYAAGYKAQRALSMKSYLFASADQLCTQSRPRSHVALNDAFAFVLSVLPLVDR